MIVLDMLMPVLGQILLLAVLITILLQGLPINNRWMKIILVSVLLLSMLLPIYGLTIGQWLRSLLGDLSVLTIVVLANILSRRLWGGNLIVPNSRIYLLAGIAIVGILFYPFVLGLSPIDPYYWGYAPLLMVLLTISGSVYLWMNNKRDLAIILLLPLFAFNLKLLESVNLWDYFFDPVIVIYAVVQTVAVLKSLRKI